MPQFCVHPPRASNKSSGDDFSLPPIRPQGKRNFEPFDGSTPLLPQWRPPSVEAEFNYSARRVVSRERVSKTPAKRLVKVANRGYGTLFAEVVQEIDEGEGKLWLRPLLLDSDDKDENTFVDLRGGSDLVLSKSRATELDDETKIRVTMNMVATESDLIDRALSDERWNEIGSTALIKFMTGLSSNQDQ